MHGLIARSCRLAAFAAIVFFVLCACFTGSARSQLEDSLRTVPAAELAALAKRNGDAARGAIVFYQPSLACTQCHATSPTSQPLIGPKLTHEPSARWERLPDAQLVEALLEPSKSIREGYTASRIRTGEGEVLTGIIQDRTPEFLALRTANGESIRLSTSELEAVESSSQSLMPAGQMNQLTSQQQFLDLVRYLMEIRDAGPERAAALKPAESLLVLQIPAYESSIDHAGMLRDWDKESLERGQVIYGRVCANCHGTQDQLGSLPTALRFGEGKFKNGDDPYSMYRTLTHGFGFMPAQTWMVPQQKYDAIHYIRETFLRSNPNVQSRDLTDRYLSNLPSGNTRGPEPRDIEVWSAMDYGNHLAHCYEIPGTRLNIAYKGIAIRLDPGPGGVTRGDTWMIFDTDTLRWAAGWTTAADDPKSRFIDWRDIQFNGEHGIHPRIVGQTVFSNAIGPGWANPSNGSLVDDQRVVGRDGRRYGPLPKDWAVFHGTYTYGQKTIVSYAIGGTEILESPTRWLDSTTNTPVFARVLNIEPHASTLEVRVADLEGAEQETAPEYLVNEEPASDAGSDKEFSASSVRFGDTAAGVYGQVKGMNWKRSDGQMRLAIPANTRPIRVVLWTTEASSESELAAFSADARTQITVGEMDLSNYLSGGTARWSQVLESSIANSFASDDFAIETLTSPEPNPWLAQMRLTGLDFFADGSMAVCSWDGDVWHVREIHETGKLEWRRIASGLYQPLGLKILKDTVYLTCRDQLAVLRDLNGDGETDFVQCLNQDHQVTEHFHEFAMGLQVDDEGYFYYAKSGRHALPAVVPQHGTLLRVSPDGATTEILATGFRAANGVCLNPDGSFIVTDQEGFWNPKNRINWVTRDPNGHPKFYGNMFGYHDVTDPSDAAMEPPLCWITNAFDRSPAELLWVDSPTWGELRGGLLSLSYGYGKIFWVLHEVVDGVRQGGMIELPFPSFPTGVMRGRFHPEDHHLYTCGMFSWAGSATAPGGLYRVRKMNTVSALPISLAARQDGLHLRFAQPMAAESLSTDRVHVRAWDLKRTKNYGSEHYNERELPVAGIELSDDGHQVRLLIDGLQPTWGMSIEYEFLTAGGKPAKGLIHNTIHTLGSD